MCIALVVPAGKIVKSETLVECFNGNPHGMGMAYINNGKVEMSKGFFKIGEFIPAYKEKAARFGDYNPMLLHFRIATQGKINGQNCHPFPIKGGALVHNGSLWHKRGGITLEKSDTREFAERMYNNLSYDVVKAALPEISEALEWNKIAMLYDDGRYIRLGKWYEDDGIWYSNEGYRPWQSTFTRNLRGPSCDI